VRVTDSLLADDYAGGRLQWVLDEHRRLLSELVADGATECGSDIARRRSWCWGRASAGALSRKVLPLSWSPATALG
jgi:hypothetical protein